MSWIINDMVSDLSEFLDVSVMEVEKRFDSNYYNKVHFDDEKGRENFSRWLRESEYYLYDLAQWHIRTLANYNPPQGNGLKCLDFGSGIGTRSLFYTLNGWDMTLCEINKPCMKFSKFRYEKHGLKAEFVEKLNRKDCFSHVLLIDVIGHLETPEETLKEIVSSMKVGATIEITWDLFDVPTRTHLWMKNKMDTLKTFMQSISLTKLNENDTTWQKT